eukprot:TRINITY_DN4139_c0_g1_i6.p3 TRINITY_DN4139_c0_g1~~TRINITY_DN4139_c0_g1_i6.p3  ORF type:complete len:144 (-),score=31.61 TRINITY_DN4139_c0_g1_i6:39-470(-)
MNQFPSAPGAAPEGLERADSGASDWEVIDDSEFVEAIQWEHDQTLLKESREREASIRAMEQAEFGLGPPWTCHNCTLENPRQITQCGACGSVNHRALDEQASKQEQSTWSMSNTTFGAVAGACLLYTSPSPRDRTRSRMPSSA